MKYETASLISTLENRVEAQLAFTIKVLQNLQTEVLVKPSPEGGWSIVQILNHLNSYGNYYLPRIDAKLEMGSTAEKEYFKSGLLGDYFIKMIHPTSGTKKINAAKIHLPADHANPMETIMEFIRQEELLLHYLFRARKMDLESVRVPISIAKIIRLKLGDILLFVINHVDRHLVQASRFISREEGYTVGD